MKNENGYVDSFVKLIQCPTVTNSGHEYFDAFHKVLDKEFPNVTAKCEKIDIGGDLLLYKWSGKSNTRPLVLMAHQVSEGDVQIIGKVIETRLRF